MLRVGAAALDELEDALHRLALPDDLLEAEPPTELVLEPDVLAPEPPVLEGPADGHEEVVVLEGLLDVVEGPLLHGRDGRFDRGVGGDDDDHGIGIDPLQPVEDLDAVHAGHEQVEER